MIDMEKVGKRLRPCAKSGDTRGNSLHSGCR